MRPVTNGLFVSRRNLLSLLAKLDGAPNGSFCEIVFRHPDEAPFHLYAEEDAVHYAHPSRLGSPPGEMHEDTEHRISQEEFRARRTFPIAAAREYISHISHREFPSALGDGTCRNTCSTEGVCTCHRAPE